MAKDLVSLALTRKLAAYEGAGLSDHADRVKARLGEVEKVAAIEAEDDLTKLSKADLVVRADAAGIETDGKTKAELIDELEGADD